nr:MAG TPA: Helix-turn-helix XRE-family like protein [Caudoviricetes sp.]
MENKIRVIRAEKKISQQKLAEMAGISRGTLNRIENGKAIPSGKTMLNLAQVLDVEANELFFNSTV